LVILNYSGVNKNIVVEYRRVG